VFWIWKNVSTEVPHPYISGPPAERSHRAMGRTPPVLHQGRLLWGICQHPGLPSAPHQPVEGSLHSAVILRG